MTPPQVSIGGQTRHYPKAEALVKKYQKSSFLLNFNLSYKESIEFSTFLFSYNTN